MWREELFLLFDSRRFSSHPSASGEQGTWLFSVREALIMLVALLLRTVVPPDRYLRELIFGSSGKPLGFFGHLGRLYVSLHRFLFSARRICQILFVVGLNSKYWVLSSVCTDNVISSEHASYCAPDSFIRAGGRPLGLLLFAMSAGRLEPFHSELIATVPAIGGSVLLFTFAYPVGALTSYMSLVTVTDPEQQSSGKSGKFRFDDWYFAAFPAEYERIKFYMPTGPECLLFPDTVMIHPSGLLLCGQNKYVRHWLDVFLRDKLPPRVVVNLTHDQEFLLHMHVSQWNRTFIVKQNQFDWVEPPQPSRKTTLPSSFEEETLPSSNKMPTAAEVPHFDAASSTNATTDQWLLLMMHPQLQAVSQELQTLSQELSRAADSADSATSRDLSAIQTRNLASSFLVDAILAQWEHDIRPFNVHVDAEDAEMGASSQDDQ